MRGSGAFRTGIAPGGALAGPWVRDPLWTRARAVPSLDLRFANNKSLVDAKTGASLVTFTRASTGTYVGSDGLVKTAVTNLLLRSEEFDNAFWSKIRSTISANATLAPNGTTTADKFIEDTTASNTHILVQGASVSSGTIYTASFYLKAGERNFIYLSLSVSFAGGTDALFNASTGVATSLGVASCSMTPVGNGWYRCVATATANATGTGNFNLYSYNGSTIVYTGDGTSGIYLWGAQLEQSATVSDYVPTAATINSAPRFDHNPTTGESLGLLVEEARTNLVLQSEDLSTSWTNTNTTETTNAATAPDGTTTADKLVETAVTGEHNIRQDSTSQAAGTYTFSIFAKAAERTFLQFAATGVLGSFRANFNIGTGTLGSSDPELIASIVSYGNGWYKCIVTRTTTATGTLRSQWNIVTSSSAARVESYAGDSTSGLLLWGAQLEAGAFATSYIPTTTATVTRAADVASITGTNFSSWYNQTEGTVFAEVAPAFQGSASAATNNPGVWGVTQNSLGSFNGYGVRLSSNSPFNDSINGISRYAPSAFNNQVSIGVTAYLNTGQNYRTMFAWEPSGIAGSSQGQTATTNTNPAAAAMGTHDQFYLGRQNIGGTPTQLGGTIKRLTYWPTRLANPTLQSISAP